MDQILISGVAGGSAGIFTDFLFFPVETIRTRIQASNIKIDYYKSAARINKYRGLLAQLTVSFPSAFLFFSTYDTAKKNGCSHIVAAGLGEFAVDFFRNPFEVVKNQMQVGLDPNIRNTIRSIYQIQGFRGFYAGFPTFIMREIPFSAIQFPLYEKMKTHFGNDGVVDHALNGAVAGGTAAFLTTPCDVVKAKLMTQRNQFYDSISECIKIIYETEGILGFFRAVHIRTMQISTSGIVFFSAYERCKFHILAYNDKS
ncbi:unnamed protein product [Paramecium octaurelia]|uniref:Mitochondrial carrier protein n=1 Tax=Paramecium octaurelia TaxID=43137 RepID=A0A8S1SR82_PAROT|nr:unnamed protein product [Paramecium octaurelia]